MAIVEAPETTLRFLAFWTIARAMD